MRKDSKKYGIYLNYSLNRFKFDRKRKIVWEEITRYLKRWVNREDFVVELGSGYCDFINLIKARKKIAIDKFINPKNFCKEDVGAISAGYEYVKKLKDNSIDVFFASNFFEHLTIKECEECIKLIRKKIKKDGKLIIIQPNYKYCKKNYFDDYTHKTIWNDESIEDFLQRYGFKIILKKPKFLPFSMNSKLPKFKFLVKLYLYSPIKPFAGQMLIIAKKG